MQNITIVILLVLNGIALGQNTVTLVPFGSFRPYGSAAAAAATTTPTVVTTPAPAVSAADIAASVNAACNALYPLTDSSIPLCAPDGNIYLSIERARCVNPTNYQIFRCYSNTMDYCAASCKSIAIYACKQNCTEPNNGNQICATDGLTYLTNCQMKCQDPTLTTVYTCNIFDARCGVRCSYAVSPANNMCMSKCPKDTNLICGSDGSLYTSMCHMSCVNPMFKSTFTCAANQTEDACRRQCQMYYMYNAT